MSSRKNKTKSILIFVISALVVAVGVFGALKLVEQKQKGEQGIGENQSTEIDSEGFSEEAKAKIEKIREIEEREKNQNQDISSELTGEISYQNLDEGILRVRVVIEQVAFSDGACKISIAGQDGGEVYSNLVQMQANSSYYSCSFNEEIDTLGLEKGKYNFAITMTAGEQNGNLEGAFQYE